MSSTLGASLLRTVLSDGTLKILGSGLDKGPIIMYMDLLENAIENMKRTICMAGTPVVLQAFAFRRICPIR